MNEPGRPLQFVYFPTTAVVSLMHLLEDGSPSEVAVVGNEGVVGISVFLGSDSTHTQAVVHKAGFGFRMQAQTIKDEFDRSASVRHLMLRYTQALTVQMAQTGVCNRHHLVTQQLCRRLLFGLDRVQGNHLSMTHELIANMLGVRRERVTLAALQLQADGLIQYERGRISVTNRQALEQRSCECYAAVKAEYRRLLPVHAGHIDPA